MRVHVEDDIYLSGDRYGFTIERMTVVKSGKNEGDKQFMAMGHYSQLASAVNGLVKLKLSESTAYTLGQLLRELKEHRERIEALVLI